MRRRECDRAAAREGLERRGGQCPALGGIGAAADFVEQHERAGTCAVQNLAQHGDVRRKGRKARRDRLAVADVGKDLRKDRQRGMRPDRWDDAALGHQCQQTDRLDQHGLAAGIGTGDQDGEFVGVQFEVERDDDV